MPPHSWLTSPNCAALALSPRRPLSYRSDAAKVARIKQPFPHTFDQQHIGVKGGVVREIRCDGQGLITNGPEQLSHAQCLWRPHSTRWHWHSPPDGAMVICTETA